MDNVTIRRAERIRMRDARAHPAKPVAALRRRAITRYNMAGETDGI